MRPVLLVIHKFASLHVIVPKGMELKPMVLWRLSNNDVMYRDIRSAGSTDETDRQTGITVISVT